MESATSSRDVGSGTDMKDKAGEATDQVKEKTSELAGQASEKVSGVASQAQDRARSELDKRSTEAGERVTGTADDLRSVGDELRAQGKDGPAKVAGQAADRIEKAGTYLTESDADRLLHDAEDFGRRQPWAVLAGAVAVGFVASRFLKASSDRRHSTSQPGSNGHAG